MVRNSTLRSGCFSFSRFAVLMPSSGGMVMSSRTMSGCSVSARRSVSVPSSASPTTSKSGSARRIPRRPVRTTAWSSAIRMRIGTWHLHHDGRTCPWRAFHAQGPVQGLGALLQSNQTEVIPALDLARFESDAVVLDHHEHPVAAALRQHVDPGRAGVAHDVGHRLLDHAVESRLHRHWQTHAREPCLLY